MAIQLLADFTGGESDLHPGTLGPNQCAIAQDVDFYRNTLGGRRNGSILALSGLASNINGVIVHHPVEDGAQELWTLNEARAWIFYDEDFVPTPVTPDPADIFNPLQPINGATLHGKLFVAASTTRVSASGVALDRLHVWDGTKLRRTGMAAPAAAPTAANTGSGGVSGLRYYRVRFVDFDGTTVLRRSEPSDTLTFTPSGSGSAVRLTRPTQVNEGETHWEVEESSDLQTGNFYRIARVVIGTTTYDDTIDLPQLIAITDGVILSEQIGDYTLQRSYRYLVADRDRILGFGNFSDLDAACTVEWSVVGTDTSGVGNDERIRERTGNRLNLDGRESGDITGAIAHAGNVFGFKHNRVYSMTNSGEDTAAYDVQIVSRTYGALDGSVVEGTDAQGRAAVYFVDPQLGPMRLGANGFEWIAPGLQDKFTSEVNFDALYRVVNAVYHPDRGEVWWHFAGKRRLARGCCPPAPILPDWPSFRWVFDVSSGGSSFQSLPRLARATAYWNHKPHVTAEGGAFVRCDEDEAPDDYGNGFRAYVRSAAMELRSLVGRFEVKSAMVEARSIGLSPGRRFGCATPSGVNLTYSLIRDYGRETASFQFLLDQRANEQYVIVPLDNAHMAEATAIQVEIGDAAEVSVSPWQLYRSAFNWKNNGENVS